MSAPPHTKPQPGETFLKTMVGKHPNGREFSVTTFDDGDINRAYKDDVLPTKEQRKDNWHNVMKACDACNKQAPRAELMTCSRCKAAFYCSSQCQKKDWKSHKPECGSAGSDPILRLAERSLADEYLMDLILFAIIHVLEIHKNPQSVLDSFIRVTCELQVADLKVLMERMMLQSQDPSRETSDPSDRQRNKDTYDEMVADLDKSLHYKAIDKVSRESAPPRVQAANTAFRETFTGTGLPVTIWFVTETGGGEGELTKTLIVPLQKVEFVHSNNMLLLQSVMTGNRPVNITPTLMIDTINHSIESDKLNRMKLRVKAPQQ